MAKRDYIVEGEPSIPEEIHVRKRDAIRAAKEMARKSGENAYIIPCVDGYANDFVPHYKVTPDGEIIEMR